MIIKNIPLAELKPNPSNPRVITEVMLSKLEKSIIDFPEMLNVRPLIISKDNTILAGNMRHKVLSKLNYETVPCVYAEELTEQEQKDLLIKNNLSYGEWDWEDIITNWQLDSVKEWGLDIPGFYFDDDEEPDFEFNEELNRIKAIGIVLQKDHYIRMLDELNAIVRREDLADYSDAVLFLINKYENN
jgi:hypothetical protein